MQKIKVQMTAKGTVRNPDGTTKQIELKAEKLVTPAEAKKYGYHAIRSSGNSGG
jgi:hypothetical protein